MAIHTSEPILKAKLEDGSRVWALIADRILQHELAAAARAEASAGRALFDV
ncbi:hypothetical protein [Aureimonas leprariae]|uniref:hypothetical protein n=1 Tax=Plantimonas leprariae TaxID=2615207 RepID=UPI001386F5F5|nr:hypothetical protein [Aureimonas leprariae]